MMPQSIALPCIAHAQSLGDELRWCWQTRFCCCWNSKTSTAVICVSCIREVRLCLQLIWYAGRVKQV